LRAAAGASGVSFTSGGYRKYRMAGAVSRQISPGTSPASAHCPQLMVKPSESRARLTCAGGAGWYAQGGGHVCEG
jgi:hypothetical protein